MAVVAVLAASFGLRVGREPNPCNIALAEEAMRICFKLRDEDGHKFKLIAQWEIAEALRDLGYERYITEEVKQRPDGTYLGTKEIYDDALEIFQMLGCVKFVAVANPFMHLFVVRRMATQHFSVLKEKVRWIGFDRESDQWWCRSWWQLVAYSLMTLTGYHGFGGMQAKA